MKPLTWLFSLLLMFAFSLMATAISNDYDDVGFYQKSECINYVLPGVQVNSIKKNVINHAVLINNNLYKIENATLKSSEVIAKRAILPNETKENVYGLEVRTGLLLFSIQRVDNKYNLQTFNKHFGSMNKLL